MTTIHLQTETGHSAARTLKYNSDMLSGQVYSLRQALGSLYVSWQGTASEEFNAEAESLLRGLQSRQESLAVLADRLQCEIEEWEEVDNRGAGVMRGSITGGQGSSGPSFALPIALSVGWLPLAALPAWLSQWLTKLFPSETVVSPIVDDQPAPAVNETAQQPPTFPHQKSKFGELLEKAEKEKQEQEQGQQAVKPAEQTPKPDHIKDYPARADDGTYLVGQEKSDSCSIASTKMALERVEVDAKESDLRTASSDIEGGYEDNTNKWGTNPSTLDDLVNSKYGDSASATYNNPDTQTISDLDTASNNGDGIVVSVKNSEWFGEANSHSVTVVDVITNENGKQMVLVNDPWPPGEGKRLEVPAEDFEKAWWGDAMYVSKKVNE